MAKGNRFKKEHPVIDPNDPAVLITAGLVTPTSAPETPQEAPEVEEVSTDIQTPEIGTAEETPAAVEPAEEVVEQKPGRISIDDIDEEIKQASKKKQVKKNTSFTLSPEVIREIERRSKKAGKTKASYLDDLLKRVFEL